MYDSSEVAETDRRSHAAIEVKLYDRRVTEESVPRMIDALTKALADTSGADPAHIQVVIQGVDPKIWGSPASSRPETR